jgi:NAD-dependent dihydropyrimidine dehydrogenase PreA subunit
VIELVLADRCIECDKCVRVCPTDVFDAVPGAPPVIARQSDCQTCFLCELYCPVDALFVDPDCRAPVAADEEAVLATDWPAQYRRDSGWGRARRTHPNESWRMGDIFATARDLLTERPNVAFGASDAPKAAFGASDATKATLGTHPLTEETS